MTEIPILWLWVSGVFFAANTVLIVVLIFALLKARQVMEETRPKIAELAARGQQVANRVEQVALRVEEVATSLKDTVDTVGGRAKGVVGSAELVAHTATRQFERISPMVVGAMTVFKMLGAFNDIRHARAERAQAKEAARRRRK